MVTFTTNQWVIVLLVLMLGWLLGLLTRSSGTKWRHMWQEERALREAAEARAVRAEARLTDVERAVSAPVAAPAVARAPASPIHSDGDDLALIKGIGPSGQARLREFGITRYRQIVGLDPREEADLEARIGARPGTIEAERWREQADLLARGEREEHRAQFSG